MKKVIRVALVLVAAAAITTGAYLYFRPTKVVAATNVSTATVSSGTLAATVTAAGNIQANQTADLAFGQTGTVKTINVTVGQAVKAGEVLGGLDTADLALQVRSAQVALKNAQDNLAKAKNPNSAQDIATARAKLDSAQAAYDALVATSKSDASAKVASAAAALQSAQTNLTTLKNQVTAADLASAKATLTQAQNDLNTLLAGSDANTLDIAQNNVDSAQIALDQANLKLQQAQVVAPFDGVVTAVSAKIGQTATGTAFSIANINQMQIVVNLAETDVNKIKVGQQVEVTLDAVADATLQGTVSQIAPAGTSTSGVVNYPVTINLTNPPAAVKSGMTANLNIIVEQRNNVLTVPNRAIKTVNRQKVVTVLFEGQQIQTPVQTGLSNDTSTEITSGLKEGDVVVLSSTTTSSSTRTATGGGAGVGIPGVGRIGG